MARSLVGVTVHDNVLRGMEIARDQPRRWGEVPLDAGVIDQGAVVDVAAFAGALEALWKSAGFSSKRMALAIEAEAATIRRVSLPGSVAEDIAEAAAYDIAEVLAYPAAEAVIDHAVLNAVSDQPLVETDGLLVEAPSIETLVVAVRRETIEGFTRAAKIAGLRWVRAELTPAANVSLLPRIRSARRSERWSRSASRPPRCRCTMVAGCSSPES
ncbi:MAG: pilus assembly protein PilM [Acidimicrobiales bacterium]